MHADFLYNPDGLGVHAHCPTLLHSSLSGDLIAAWYAYPGDHDYQNARLVLCRRSGITNEWQKSKELLGPFQYSAGNPVLVQDPLTNEILLFFALLKGNYWNDGILYLSKSADDGLSWSPPTAITQEPGFMVRHPAYFLENNSYLLPVYHEDERHSYVMRDWHKESRQTVHEFSSNPLIQPVLVRGEEKRFYLFFRPFGEPRVVWRSASSDGGRTWSEPVQTSLSCPLSGVSAFYFDKTIAVVHNSSPDRRYPLSISLSGDEGISWSAPIIIDDASHEVSYPDFRIDDRGVVRGVYSYNRRMIKFREFSFASFLDNYGKNR